MAMEPRMGSLGLSYWEQILPSTGALTTAPHPILTLPWVHTDPFSLGSAQTRLEFSNRNAYSETE